MINVREYAKALFLVTEEAGKTDSVLADLELAVAAFAENPEYKTLLDTPALSREERLGLIDSAFSEIDESLKNLIKILCERHSVYQLERVSREFLAIYDESRGIERVEAVSAVPLTDEQIEKMKAKLEALTGKTVYIKNEIDREILGGIKLRYSGIQLDGSIKTRLLSFEKQLKGAVI